MAKISRRSLIQSSATAAIAVCVPEIWAQKASTKPRVVKQEAPPAPFNFMAEYLKELKTSRAYTLDCAHAMPAEKYGFKPVAEVRTFGQQMFHIAEGMKGIWQMFVEEKKFDKMPFTEGGTEQVGSKAEVIAKLNDAFDYVEKTAGDLSAETPSQQVKLFGRATNKYDVMHLILDHNTHHRGQSIVYLRINGIKPPDYKA